MLPDVLPPLLLLRHTKNRMSAATTPIVATEMPTFAPALNDSSLSRVTGLSGSEILGTSGSVTETLGKSISPNESSTTCCSVGTGVVALTSPTSPQIPTPLQRPSQQTALSPSQLPPSSTQKNAVKSELVVFNISVRSRLVSPSDHCWNINGGWSSTSSFSSWFCHDNTSSKAVIGSASTIIVRPGGLLSIPTDTIIGSTRRFTSPVSPFSSIANKIISK
mmetsp:Transcript_7804/g.19464  ORF Transcript_7804/g.19464 Transcript_7804/m.19464 type:complete len:220 (-) Transcript_7804:2168-2827(-)